MHLKMRLLNVGHCVQTPIVCWLVLERMSVTDMYSMEIFIVNWVVLSSNDARADKNK